MANFKRRKARKGPKRRYYRRERRKGRASKWKRGTKTHPQKVGHGPN